MALGGLMAVLLLVGVQTLWGGVISRASAEAASSAAGPAAPATDYSTYPGSLPAGCAGGATALRDVRFDDGHGDSSTDLTKLSLRAGAVLTMTWSAVSSGCGDASGQPALPVSLAAHQTKSAQFDPTLDQPLVSGWATCGGGGTSCAQENGRYRLQLVVPAPASTCAAQIDAVLGLPLGVVGPHGSYYSAALRADNRPSMLVSYGFVKAENCAAGVSPERAAQPGASPTTSYPTTTTPPPTTPPSTTPVVSPPQAPGVGVSPNTASGALPSTAAAAPAVAPLASQTGPAASQPPASSTPTSTSTTTPPRPTTSPNQDVQVRGITATLPSTLPATGRPLAPLTLLAVLLLVLGVWVRLAGARLGADWTPKTQALSRS